MPVAGHAQRHLDVRLDRALVNRYAHDLELRHVYVDLDDTLIVRDAVNARSSPSSSSASTPGAGSC